MKNIIAMLMLVSAVSLSAQTPIDRIFLSDGSKIEGYISSQIPGEKIVVTPTDADMRDGKNHLDEYPVEINKIIRLEKIIQERDSLIQDIIITKNGEKIQGFVVSTFPGHSITVVDKKHHKHVVKFTDVVSEEREITNGETWKTRSRYIDCIECENGSTYEGFLKIKDYGTEPYIILIDSTNNKINMSEVKEIRKRINDKYEEVKLASLEVGFAKINNKTYKFLDTNNITDERTQEEMRSWGIIEANKNSVKISANQVTITLPKNSDPE